MQQRLWIKPAVVMILVMIVIGNVVATPSMAQPSEPTAIPVLKQLWRDSLGTLGRPVWSEDGSLIAAPSTYGIWLFTTDKFRDAPVFIPVSSVRINSNIRISPDNRYLLTWFPLKSTAFLIKISDQSSRLLSVDKGIVEAAFIPKNNRVILGSVQKNAKRVVLTWVDLETAELKAKVTRTAIDLRELFVTPAGKQVGVAYTLEGKQADRLPEVFDSETGVEITQNSLRLPAQHRIWRFVPDLKRAIALPGKGEQKFAVYDLLTGEQIVALEDLSVDLFNTATQFRVSDTRLTMWQQNRFDVWDLTNGRRIISQVDDSKVKNNAAVLTRSFNSDSTQVLEASADFTLTIRAIYPTSRILSQRDDLGTTSSILRLNPTEDLLASLKRAGIVQTIDAATGKRLQQWQIYDQPCPRCRFGMVFTPDGKQLITIDPSAIKFWDPRTAALLRKVDQAPETFDSPISRIEYKELGLDQGARTLYYRQTIQTAAERLYDTIQAVDLTTGEKVALPPEITFRPQWITLQFNADGTRALVANAAGRGGTVLLWKLGETKLTGAFSLGRDAKYICGMGFSGDLPYGVFSGKNSNVLLIRTVQPSGQVITKSINLTNEKTSCNGVRLSPDGQHLLIHTTDYVVEDQTYHTSVQLWDLQTRRQIASLPLTVDSFNFVLSADGKTLITSNGDGTVRAWAVP